MNIVSNSLKYLEKREKLRLLIVCILIITSSFLELFGIGLILPILNLIVDNSYYSNNNYFLKLSQLIQFKDTNNLIFFLLISILFLNFIKSLILTITLWFQNFVISKIHIRVTNMIYEKYINSPWTFFLNKNSATILRNVHSNTHEYTSKILNSLLAIFSDTIILILLVLFLFYINFQVTMLALIFFLFLGFIIQQITKKYNHKYGIIRQEFLKLVNKHLLESFKSFKLIKINIAEKFFFRKYKYISSQEIFSKMKQDIIQKVPKIWIEYIVLISICLFLIFSINKNDSLIDVIPLVGIFIVATFKILPSINRILISVQALRFAAPALNNLNNEITEINIKKNFEDKTFEKMKFNFISQIEMKNLTFKHENAERNIFENFNFEIKKNDFIGIIGRSGSGKSTLIDLLMGIIKPITGDVLVDEVSIFRNVNIWFKSIGYVPQETYLLDDSIRNNIAFGSEEETINDNQINEILKNLDLYKLIEERKDGLNTIVGENGVKLSGGQKQRIGLARALYQNPEILILDEFTSSLDIQTEEKILKELNKFKNKLTIIFVSHRNAVIKYCDKTINLEK